ncbi:type 1 glutamine amidotransferase domain-containing protein [Stutzerimonas tarimensis]|uniref:Type 1 glutamine amidotransferase domain-containing protein n=1 Tax=Stutzerimonas tarimensis TaxID=1507735 RepID=A0ABV7T4P9_9GAMM
MKILMVLTSHAQLGDTGKPTGFWLEEFAAPFYLLKDEGAEIVLASPRGGQPPLDPKSAEEQAQTAMTRRFEADSEARARLASTFRLDEVSAVDFDALFFPGGHGPLWDLTENPVAISLIEGFIDAGKPVAAVCHAPAVLLNARGPDGEYLVKGKLVTGFANSEEAGVELTDVVPFLLEDELRARGGQYSKGDDWGPYVRVDGLLITGQNPASSEPAAEALIRLLEIRGVAGGASSG